MERLAIDGGPKVIEEALPREWPGLNWVGPEERQAVLDALDGKLPPDALATDLRAFYECPTAVITNGGTSSLFVALAALGIKPGMEVLVPGFCWIPTFGCIVGCGAIPVLVEVGEDLQMDPEDMERKITPRTAAVIVVHMCGAAADMDRIMPIARRHNLKVIEDCAQDGAGRYKGKFVGLFGDVGCFSLQQNKHFTSYLGGYMISRDPGMAVPLGHTSGLGFRPDLIMAGRRAEDDVYWGTGRIGNPLAEAMAREQLKKAPRIIAAMQRAQRRIIAGIRDIPGLRLRPLADPAGDCGSFLITHWPDVVTAARAAKALSAEGTPELTSHLQEYNAHMYYFVQPLVEKVGWTRGGPCPWECPFNKGSDYTYGRGSLPRMDGIFSRGVVMAVPSKLTDDQADRIAAAYRKVAAHVLGG